MSERRDAERAARAAAAAADADAAAVTAMMGAVAAREHRAAELRAIVARTLRGAFTADERAMVGHGAAAVVRP